MSRRYRIVRDSYAGYEVQFKSTWWPFWRQVGGANTHRTLEQAEKFARDHAQPVVKYLGKITEGAPVVQPRPPIPLKVVR